MTDLLGKALLQKDMIMLPEVKPATTVGTASETELAAVLYSFSSLGYTLDENSIKKLCSMDRTSLNVFYFHNYELLSHAKGADVKHKVFYPNFPDMEGIMPAEYYIRAILHYVTKSVDDYGFDNGDLPQHEAVFINNPQKTVLRIVDRAEADAILIKMAKEALQQAIAIPQSKREMYMELWRAYPERIFPETIPFKENMALFVKTVIRQTIDGKPIILYEQLSFCKTVTDILRVYAIVSCNTASLNNVKFVSLPRASRRALLQKLNKLADSSNAAEDMQRHEFLWKKAAELLHPYDFRKQFPEAFDLITALRNDTLPQTFYSYLDSIVKNPDEYIRVLSARPTEYARRLDYMLRSFGKEAAVLDTFAQIASEVPTNTLLGLWKHFLDRKLANTDRTLMFFSHGTAHFLSMEDNRQALSESVCDKVIEIIKNTLSNKFRKYPQKGKLFIDETMDNYIVPQSDRLGSYQNHTMTSGSRMPLDYGKGDEFIRIFTHWKNKKDERVDIDLSVALWSEDLQFVRSICWYNMSDGADYDSYHSGDLTTAPEGATEFIDFNWKKASKFARYAVVGNYNFTGQPFNEIPECFSGIMTMPKKAKKGTVFNPQFVKQKFDLLQTANKNILFVVDLVEETIIWADANIMEFGGNMLVMNDDAKMTQIILYRLLLPQISMGEWLKLHSSHLELTENREDADYIADNKTEADISPFDTIGFVANWM